jgi:hypothetical protein
MTTPPSGPADDQTVDRDLGAVLDEVITAIQETKQAEWPESDHDRRRALDELRTFLIGQAVAISEAEERIGGRDPSLLNPTGHQVRDLRAEAGGDRDAWLVLLFSRLQAVAADARARAAPIEGASEEKLFVALADGLDHRLAQLRER